MTTQNVAWPTMIVQMVNCQPPKPKKELSAIPVMIPGRASGRTKTYEIVSRPKNRNALTANAPADPSTRAIEVATRAAFRESTSARPASSFCQAELSPFVEKPAIGQLWMFEELKA